MNRTETFDKIAEVIRNSFTVMNEDFVTDKYWGFIEKSVEILPDESHAAFAERLSKVLNDAFPNREYPINVDTCDTIYDILHNNFIFDDED